MSTLSALRPQADERVSPVSGCFAFDLAPRGPSGSGACRGTPKSQSLFFILRRAMPFSRWIQAAIVVGVVLLAVALIAPAIQQAREGARRTQSANHLRQIGLAL